MNVRSEPTTVADTLCAPTQRGASSAAAVPGGLEMALSAQVNWNNDRSCVRELCGLETWNCSFYKVKVNLCITWCKCRGIDNDVNFVLKIWTSALMEPTCAANTQTVRTPWGRTAVSVRTATRAMALPAQVGLLWKQLCSSCWKAEHPTLFLINLKTNNSFLRLGHASQVTEMTAYLRFDPHGMKPWRQVTKQPSKS